MVDKMDTNVKSGVMPEKIKAFEPHIIVNKNLAEPYYSIMYYDTSDKEWHIGFGSYCLSYVRQWLKEEFEVVDIEFKEVVHGEWVRVADTYGKEYLCSACKGGIRQYIGQPYCSSCGAIMDGGNAE